MTKRTVHYAISCLFLLSAAVGATANAGSAESGQETGAGFRLIIDAPSRLRDILQSGLDISRWQNYVGMTLPLLQSLIRDARAQALEAAATEGYYNAQVAISIDDVQQGRRTVHLQVTPNEPVLVANVSITLSGNQDRETEFALQRVRESWRLAKGDVFRQSSWAEEKNRALAVFARTRYVGAAVTESRATVDPKANSADLMLVIDPGPVFSFGPITVTGLSKYPAKTVTTLAPFKTGDPYEGEKIEVFLRRLNATNYFASSQVAIDSDRNTAFAVPVRVSVIEAPTRRLETGVGYSTDTLYRATAAWRDVNLFDSAYRLSMEIRLETNLQQLGLNLDLPTGSNGWADSFETTTTRTDIQGLITHGQVVGVSRRSVDERRQTSFGLSYYYEQQRRESAEPDLTRALFAHYGYTWRTTDDLVSPHAGVVANLELGVGTPVVSTDTFGRVIGQLAWFHALSPRDDTSLRGELAAVFGSVQRIPQALLFRTGGDTSVRGYAFNSLGVEKDGSVVGGRYYALASAEYIHWFADSWGMAAFVDSGNAADKIDEFKFATGYGVGARVKTPIGPLRLDLAYGKEAREVRIHFSAGLAF